MIPLMLLGLGLIFGSFVNALVWRLKKRRNWLSERSECPHCHHVLAPKDLVPVLSWLMLRGKCRYCKHPIEDSPLTELALPALFLLSYYAWPTELVGAGLFSFICWLVFLIAFLALTIYDLRWYLLPDKIVYPLNAAAFAQQFIVAVAYGGGWAHLVQALGGALVVSGLFYVLFQVSNGSWIGGGDVKLGIALGLLAGDPMRAVLLLFIASVGGMLASLPLVFNGKAKRKTQIPFGPFLILGLIITRLFGAQLINWYAGLFGG